MSGEPKTLTLTTRHGYAPVTYEMDEDNTIHRITFHLPPGAALAGPDGAPVAARDEAAELRAENERLHAGLTRLVGMLDAANRDGALIRLNDISSHLRRLAASEGQS